MDSFDVSKIIPPGDYVQYIYEAVSLPVSTYYMMASVANTLIGALECVVIRNTRFISSTTAITYMVGFIVALNQVLLSGYAEPQEIAILYVYTAICFAHFAYLLVCTIFTRDSYTLLLAHVVVLFYILYMYAINGTKCRSFAHVEFLTNLQFCAITVQNIIPLEAIIASLCRNSKRTPSHWLALYIGLTYCLTGGLYRHQMGQSLMASADALGISVHLFGLVVALYHNLWF